MTKIASGLVLTTACGVFASYEPPARKDDPAQSKKSPAAAITAGTAYLKSLQKNKSWEHYSNPGGAFKGGMTSLAVLALLETGVPSDDDAVAKGLAYLRQVESPDTYVTSLQTLVFCRADAKKDAAIIQRNVDLLLKAAERKRDGELIGWSYRVKGSGLGHTDNSNTQFAVMALDAASNAGAKIPDKIWTEIADYFQRCQQPDGGWCYNNPRIAGSTLSMTSAGVSCLAIVARHLKGDGARAFQKEIDKACNKMSGMLVIKDRQAPYYTLHSMARAGKLTGKNEFGATANTPGVNWRDVGLKFVLAHQEADGSWKGEGALENNRVVATSFALLFLSR
jgi:hypothetical protein